MATGVAPLIGWFAARGGILAPARVFRIESYGIGIRGGIRHEHHGDGGDRDG